MAGAERFPRSDCRAARSRVQHFEHLERVHEERFEYALGRLRPAARRAALRFLDCGLLEHGVPHRQVVLTLPKRLRPAFSVTAAGSAA